MVVYIIYCANNGFIPGRFIYFSGDFNIKKLNIIILV